MVWELVSLLVMVMELGLVSVLGRHKPSLPAPKLNKYQQLMLLLCAFSFLPFLLFFFSPIYPKISPTYAHLHPHLIPSQQVCGMVFSLVSWFAELGLILQTTPPSSYLFHRVIYYDNESTFRLHSTYFWNNCQQSLILQQCLLTHINTS